MADDEEMQAESGVPAGEPGKGAAAKKKVSRKKVAKKAAKKKVAKKKVTKKKVTKKKVAKKKTAKKKTAKKQAAKKKNASGKKAAKKIVEKKEVSTSAIAALAAAAAKAAPTLAGGAASASGGAATEAGAPGKAVGEAPADSRTAASEPARPDATVSPAGLGSAAEESPLVETVEKTSTAQASDVRAPSVSEVESAPASPAPEKVVAAEEVTPLSTATLPGESHTSPAREATPGETGDGTKEKRDAAGAPAGEGEMAATASDIQQAAEEYLAENGAEPRPRMRSPAGRAMNVLASLLVLALFAGLTIGLIMYYRATLFHDDRERPSGVGGQQSATGSSQPGADAPGLGSGIPATAVPVSKEDTEVQAGPLGEAQAESRETPADTRRRPGGEEEAMPALPAATVEPSAPVPQEVPEKTGLAPATAGGTVVVAPAAAEKPAPASPSTVRESDLASTAPAAEVATGEAAPATESPTREPAPAASTSPGTVATPPPAREEPASRTAAAPPAVNRSPHPAWQSPYGNRGYPRAQPGQPGYGTQPGRGYWRQGSPYGYPSR